MAAKSNSSDGELGDSESGSPKYGHLMTDEEQDRDIPDTFRAYDTFPAGGECELTVDDIPSDENQFGWTDHYEDSSRKRRNPEVTDEVIAELLTKGVCKEAPGSDWDNRYLVQRKIDEYEWTLVVADDGEDARDRWVMITVYSNYHGSVGTTNRYFDRLRKRRGDN